MYGNCWKIDGDIEKVSVSRETLIIGKRAGRGEEARKEEVKKIYVEKYVEMWKSWKWDVEKYVEKFL